MVGSRGIPLLIYLVTIVAEDREAEAKWVERRKKDRKGVSDGNDKERDKRGKNSIQVRNKDEM